MMTPRPTPKKPRVLSGFTFWAVALAGSLMVILACALTPPHLPLALLGITVSVLGGLILAGAERDAEFRQELLQRLNDLRVPLSLAPHHDLFVQYRALASALSRLASQTSPVLLEFAAVQLAALAEPVQDLAQGRIVFTGTEAWRTVYEKLLTSPEVKRYHSVAWVKTAEYWQDQPGRQSMRLNFEAIERGVRIERVLILATPLWPKSEALPAAVVRPWIQEQHNRGVWLYLVLDEDLHPEPDLLCDFGIYGSAATGTYELDEHARTMRFTLLFDRPSMRAACQRWERILLYAKTYSDLLDQFPPDRYEH